MAVKKDVDCGHPRHIIFGHKPNNALPTSNHNGFSSNHHQSESVRTNWLSKSDPFLGFHAKAPAFAPGRRNGAPSADFGRSRYHEGGGCNCIARNASKGLPITGRSVPFHLTRIMSLCSSTNALFRLLDDRHQADFATRLRRTCGKEFLSCPRGLARK
jgi:hypothetical protein